MGACCCYCSHYMLLAMGWTAKYDRCGCGVLPWSVYWCLLSSHWLHSIVDFHYGRNRACGAAGGTSAAALDDIRSGAHSNCSHQHDGDYGARLQAAAARGGALRPCGTPYLIFWGGSLI